MHFPQSLRRARFTRREKRFFVYATDADGAELIAHTNNTGRMTGCLSPGATVWLSPAANPARKLKWSLEIVETSDNVPVGVNTSLANDIVAEAVAGGLIPELAGWPHGRREVRYGTRGSRVDLLLSDGGAKMWVEVKNVSLVTGGHGRFPDAPTERGRKHLLELRDKARTGDRAALVFCSQRPDARTIGPADDIDPEYGELLRAVVHAGVEIYGVGCRVTPQEIVADRVLPIELMPFVTP